MHWNFVKFVNDWYSVERIRSLGYKTINGFSNMPNEYSLKSVTELIDSLMNSEFIRSALIWVQNEPMWFVEFIQFVEFANELQRFERMNR